MSSEEKQSPFVEIGEHKVFYSFGQQSFSVGTSYAEEWDKNYFVISKNSWVKDDNGQKKKLKRGVYLTLPATRALVGVLKAAVEKAEAFELKRVLLKHQAQPKKPVEQSGIRTSPGAVSVSAGGPSDTVGPSAKRAGDSERLTGYKHKFVGHSITTASTCSSASIRTGESGAKQSKLRGPRKQQQKPETAGAANSHAGRPRKVLIAEDEIDERDAGEGED